MPRKTRNRVSGEPKKPTFYADAAPKWIRKLADEVEELARSLPQERRWKAPGRIYLQFSKKDAEKEASRNAIIQKKRQGQRNG